MENVQVTGAPGVPLGGNGMGVEVPHTGLAAAATVSDLLNDAPRSRFHRRAVVISGMGFFTDAYDLFVISTVAVLVKAQWHLSTTQTSWVTGSAILAAFIGALVFGRIADVLGRKSVYVVVAVIMIVGALTSAFATGFLWLVIARFVLGLGIGGDYPGIGGAHERVCQPRRPGSPGRAGVLDAGSRPHRGATRRTVAAVIGHQPRPHLATDARPRCGPRCHRRLPAGEDARVTSLPGAGTRRGRSRRHASWRSSPNGVGRRASTTALSRSALGRMRLGRFLTDRRTLLLLLGTAGSWFLFDYAYYGNTLSLPAILKDVAPHATLVTKLAWTLGIFMVFAVPGYLLAFTKMDRIGHRRLQLIGFGVMAGAFVALGAIPVLTTMVAPFLLIFGMSYFFIEFGPNTTTFVLPSELFPVSMRTTGHGIAAGIGKLGAFIGVFLVPQLQKSIGLRGMLLVAGGSARGGLPAHSCASGAGSAQSRRGLRGRSEVPARRGTDLRTCR